MAGAFCSNCGAEVAADAKFCSSCGHAIAAEPTPQHVEPASPDHLTYSRKENPVTQGVKLGATGCVGLLTMVVIFIIVVALLAHHH